MKNILILLVIMISSGVAYSSEELLLELVYKKISLNYELTAIRDGDDIFISIDDLFYESGYLTSTKNNIITISDTYLKSVVEINLSEFSVKSDLNNSNFNKEDFVLIDNRVYFSANFIKEQLKIDLTLLITDMKVMYSDKSLFKTPIVQKIDRKMNREITNEVASKKNKYQDFNPSIFTSPSSSHNFSFTKEKGENKASSAHSFSNEFLGFEQIFNFSIDTQGKYREGNHKLSRYDENGIFPGLDITEIELFNGNFVTRDSSAVESGNSDIFISNGKRGMQGGKWDTRDFRGNLTEGWEVELYVNKRLIGVSNGVKGEYIFKDVSLNKGNNEIELVFLGPFGEIVKEKDFINVGGSSQFKDKVFYNFSFNELDKERSEYSITLNTPIGSSSSIDYTLNNSYKDIKENIFNSISYNFSVMGSDYRVFHSDSKNAGYESSISGRYNIFENKNLSFTALKRDNYSDESFNKYSARIGGRDYSTNWDLSANKTIDDLTETNSYSFYANKDIYNSNVGYSANKTNDAPIGHSLVVRKRIYDLSFSTNLSYTEDIDEYSISASRRFGDYNASIAYKNNINSEMNESIVSLSSNSSFINKNIGYRKIINSGVESEEFTLNLSFGFNDILNPSSVTNVRQQGGIKIISFLDLNNNGVFDLSEPKVEGVYFNVGRKLYTTGKDGSVIVNGLSSDVSYLVSMSDTNLDYISTSDGFEVTPHAVSIKEIYFPVNRSFELEGKVNCGDSNCAGIILAIESISGNYREVTYTTSGGFFYKDLIPMGTYTIKALNSNEYETLKITNSDKPLLDNLVLDRLSDPSP